MPTSLAKARQYIAGATNLFILTGAGVSAESGVPTFRDALTGLWANYDPQSLATPQAFVRNPALVWGWYEWRRQLLLAAQPNPAHYAITRLLQQARHGQLFTQNVDDLHERAGSDTAVHLHGSIFQPRCYDCSAPYTFTHAPALSSEQPLDPPQCPICAGLIRPGVVWFGESLPATALQQAYTAARECDLMLSVGTSGVVYPVAELPQTATENGALVIHINPLAPPTLPDKQLFLQGKAGDILPLLIK